METASPQLQAIARPDRRLSAAQVVEILTGKAQMAVATVTAKGEPRVSPLDVLLLHGRFFFCTSAQAAKVSHLRGRPAISIAYIDSDVVGITVHGFATLREWGSSRFSALDQEFLAVYGGTPFTLKRRSSSSKLNQSGSSHSTGAPSPPARPNSVPGEHRPSHPAVRSRVGSLPASSREPRRRSQA